MQSEVTDNSELVRIAGWPHDHFLDITSDVCPMTFVRAKLLLERATAGQIVLILLNSGEPLRNLPRSMRDHGYRVLDLDPVEAGVADGRHYMRVEKLA
jgi:TusA-related sulfurtransferase